MTGAPRLAQALSHNATDRDATMKLGLFGTTAALALVAGAAQAEYSLTLLHTNDFHDRYEPISKYDSTCSTEDNEAGDCFGGVARLVTAGVGLRFFVAASLPLLSLRFSERSRWFVRSVDGTRTLA